MQNFGGSTAKWKSTIAAGILCLLLSMLFFSTVKAEDVGNNAKAEGSAVESSAKDETEEQKVVRIGYFNENETFQAGFSDETRKSGYAYDYYQKIANYTGWKYEYVYGSWNELLDMLYSGKIDLMAGVSKTDGRKDKLLYPSVNMGKETYYIWVPSDSTEIRSYDLRTLDGKRIGTKKGSLMTDVFEKYMETNEISCEIVYYEDVMESYHALMQRELDGIICMDSFTLNEARPAMRVGESKLYIAVSKEREDLLKELNDAQEKLFEVSPYIITELEEKYYNKNVLRYHLNNEEEQWIKDRGKIVIGYMDDYLPYCAVDKKTGKPKGLVADLVDCFEEYLNVPVECKPYITFQEMKSALQEGEIDTAFPVYADFWNSEQNGYIQTQDIMEERIKVVYKGDYDTRIYDSVAVTRINVIQDAYLNANFPGVRRIVVNNIKEALDAVNSGRAGCLIYSGNVLDYYMSDYSEEGLRTLYLSDTICYAMAVSKKNAIVNQIVDKALLSIDNSVIADSIIRNSQGDVKYDFKTFVKHNAAVFVAIAFIVLVIVIMIFVSYYTAISERQEKILIANRILKQQVGISMAMRKAYQAAYLIDMDDDSCEEIDDTGCIKEELGSINATDFFQVLCTEVAGEIYYEVLKQFTDLSTLEERLKERRSVSIEFHGESCGWIRGTFLKGENSEEGKLKKVIYVEQRIDEEKKVEKKVHQALEEAFEAAKRANSAKSDFLSKMSHDIRTPMNAIIGMTAIAGIHLDDKERVAECLSKIEISSKHLLGIINGVLDMSKIEAGALSLEEKEFNLSTVIDSVLEIMKPQIAEKNHDFTVETYNLIHEKVLGDNMRLQQVFVNILGNAIKYTPAGGEIRLVIREKDFRSEGIGYFEFIFEDNGPGMSKEFVEHIFDPFVREKDSRIDSIQGTGLGMAITQNIVSMMDGSISVESEKGKGSRFTVTIHLKLQSEEQHLNRKYAGLCVLVVGSNIESCENICQMLQQFRLNTEWISDAELAAERMASRKNVGETYFAVFVDSEQATGDALKTIAMLRENGNEDTSIIFLATYDYSNALTEAKAEGADWVITKPLFRTKLSDQLEQLLHEENKGENANIESIGQKDFSGKRALLVEDNELNMEIIKEIFELAGIEVEVAWNGEEAVERFVESEPGHFDIIFMDIQMPVMDGYKATQIIRQLPREEASWIPIIAMTANAFSEDVQHAMRAGMSEHVSKPIDFEKLQEIMERWL